MAQLDQDFDLGGADPLMLAQEAFSEHGDRVNVIAHSDGLSALTHLRVNGSGSGEHNIQHR